jgi:hypothetical protein
MTSVEALAESEDCRAETQRRRAIPYGESSELQLGQLFFHPLNTQSSIAV